MKAVLRDSKGRIVKGSSSIPGAGSKKGRVLSLETRLKIRKAHLGMKHSFLTRQKISEVQKGKSLSIDHRRKLGLAGDKNPSWKGGVSSLSKRVRNSIEYKLWRESVFKRDNWSCLECGSRGVYLHAHHIKPFSLFPELRFAIDNGATLCVPCHEKTPTYKGKIKNYAQR